MAAIWADFPSGQRGLYGTNTARMLNGVWAQTNGVALVADPDPSIGSAGVVMQVTGSELFPSVMGGRFAYPLPQKTQGLKIRLWMPSLPTNNDQTVVIAFKNIGNTTMIAMRVLTTGAVEFRSTEGNGGTLYGTTSGPVLLANAHNDLEMKVFSDAAAGTIEFRVGTVVKLNLSGLNTNGADIAQVHVGTNCGFSQAASAVPYYKDLVLWDTTGSQVNDFQGQVAVYDLIPDGDDDLQWTPSTGATGFNLVSDDYPAATLTASGAIASGNQVRIDNTYYQFTSASVDAGTPAGTAANPWLVALGGDVATALSNLFKAVGASGVAGTDYSTALTAHPTVDANGFTATQVSVAAKIQTASAIVVTETGANLAWSAGTLTDGPTDPSYVSADPTQLTPTIFTMSDLPPDVTTVRALLPIGRMVKTDGGDCSVLMGVSPNGANWDDGTDRAITVASTYWWDVSQVSPATSNPWTPAEVNSLLLRADRTL